MGALSRCALFASCIASFPAVAATPVVVRSLQVDDRIITNTPTVLKDGNSVALATAFSQQLIFAKEGQLVQALPIGDVAHRLGPGAVAPDGTLVFGNSFSYSWILNNQITYQTDFGRTYGYLVFRPTFVENGATTVLGSTSGTVLWFDGVNVSYSYQLPSKSMTCNPIALHRDIVAVCDDRGFYWLKQGRRVAFVPVNGFGGHISQIVSLSDHRTIVASSETGSVRWMRNGRTLHQWDAPSDTFLPSYAVDRSNQIVFAGAEKIYWLRNGVAVDEFSLRAPVFGPPLVLRDGKTIVVATQDATLHWIRDRVELATLTIPTAFGTTSSPVELANGEIVFVADDTIYWISADLSPT